MKAALLFLLLVVAALLCGCTGLVQKPSVRVDAVTITALSLQRLDLDVTVTVTNPNPIGGTLREIAFDIAFLQGDEPRYLGHGERTEITIPANGEIAVTIPVSVSNPGLIGAVATLVQQGEVTFVVNGSGSLVIGGFSFDIPFEETRVVSL
jgi:LEA14-like dessication related protein